MNMREILSSDPVFDIPVMPMSREEFRDALKAVGLSQVAAAKLFTVNGRTVRHWLMLGDVPIWAVIILRLMIGMHISVEQVRMASAGKLEPRKRR